MVCLFITTITEATTTETITKETREALVENMSKDKDVKSLLHKCFSILQIKTTDTQLVATSHKEKELSSLLAAKEVSLAKVENKFTAFANMNITNKKAVLKDVTLASLGKSNAFWTEVGVDLATFFSCVGLERYWKEEAYIACLVAAFTADAIEFVSTEGAATPILTAEGEAEAIGCYDILVQESKSAVEGCIKVLIAEIIGEIVAYFAN